MRRYPIAIALATVMVVASAGAALAGEVKGPWVEGEHLVDVETGELIKSTGALDHAKSICASSGLNDNDPDEGQNLSRVQTAADSHKYYEMPPGVVGTACRGGGPS